MMTFKEAAVNYILCSVYSFNRDDTDCVKMEKFQGGEKKTTSQEDIFSIIQKRPTTVFTSHFMPLVLILPRRGDMYVCRYIY